MKPEDLTSDQKHAIIITAAEDKKANYTTSIDLRGKTLIADYFVICSGTSNIHIRSIADGIMEAMEQHGHRRELVEGYGEASWILLSYGDVIAHIMSETQRSFYRLERLWGTGDPPVDPAIESVEADAEQEAFEDEDLDPVDDDVHIDDMLGASARTDT